MCLSMYINTGEGWAKDVRAAAVLAGSGIVAQAVGKLGKWHDQNPDTDRRYLTGESHAPP